MVNYIKDLYANPTSILEFTLLGILDVTLILFDLIIYQPLTHSLLKIYFVDSWAQFMSTTTYHQHGPWLAQVQLWRGAGINLNKRKENDTQINSLPCILFE